MITGTEDRQHAYVALSRGTDTNMAYVFTVSPKRADPAPGPRPAPELARYDRITAQRDGQPAAAAAGTRDALAVLSGVLDRDGQQSSASQTRQQALLDADHLALLHAIWTGQITAAREQRYRDLLMSALPPEHRRELGHQARWLWRTMRAAELAGLDIGPVLVAAVGERDLAGARDLAAVIDARVRYRIGAVVPASAGLWSAQVPAIADPERRAFAAQIAAMMDARKDRIGEHAAKHALPWAVAALGPVPEDPLDRLDWRTRAASIGAWRELSGHGDPATRSAPSLSRPPRTCARPGKRPWPPSAPPTGRTCAACLTGGCYTCATPIRSRPPGRRNTSATSSARSAPPPAKPGWPACAPAPKPPPPPRTANPAPPPASRNSRPATRPCTRLYQQRETIFATTMADRADWEAATRAQRHLAVAADAELRRRHPGQPLPPLRSAEPEPATDTQHADLTLTPGKPPGGWASGSRT